MLCACRDSEKNEAAGWGATEDGKKELDAEAQGEADAKTEAAPGTDAPAPRRQREDYTPAVEEEEEDNTQTYDEYLAAQASKKLNIALPTARVANEGAEDEHAKYSTALDKKGEVEQEWFLGAAVRPLSFPFSIPLLTTASPPCRRSASSRPPSPRSPRPSSRSRPATSPPSVTVPVTEHPLEDVEDVEEPGDVVRVVDVVEPAETLLPAVPPVPPVSPPSTSPTPLPSLSSFK